MKEAASHKTIIRTALALVVCLVALGALSFIMENVWFARNAVDAGAQVLLQKRLEADNTSRAAALAQATAPERAALLSLAAQAGGGDVGLISDVEGLATSTKINAKVTAVGGKGPVGATPGSVALTIQFSGSFAGCIRYLKLLETLPTAENIQSASLQYDQAASRWTGLVTLFALSFDTPS